MRYVGRHRAPRPLVLRRPIIGGVAAAVLLCVPAALAATGNSPIHSRSGQVADGQSVSTATTTSKQGSGKVVIPQDSATTITGGSTKGGSTGTVPNQAAPNQAAPNQAVTNRATTNQAATKTTGAGATKSPGVTTTTKAPTVAPTTTTRRPTTTTTSAPPDPPTTTTTPPVADGT